MRGLSDPDVLLGGDLIIRKRLLTLLGETTISTEVNGTWLNLTRIRLNKVQLVSIKARKVLTRKVWTTRVTPRKVRPITKHYCKVSLKRRRLGQLSYSTTLAVGIEPINSNE